jgi:putative salt-induced outer membrane protein
MAISIYTEESMFKRSTAVVGATLGTMSLTALAQNQEEGLSGAVAFGYLATSGNSDNTNMSLTFGGDYYAEVWQHSLDGLAVKATTSNVTTAEAYGLAWESRRELADEKNYIFGLGAWNQDKFSGYDQQLREVVGYGRRIIDGDMHSFDVEAGLGFRQSDLRDGTSEDESIVRISGNYEWKISETATFSQVLATESGSKNTYTESVSKLSAKVWGNLAAVFAYTIKHNSDVPVGIQKKDTFTSVALEYSF